MVNISKVDDSTIKFTFTDNDRYLYNGEISLPLNSLILELDASDMVIFKKIDGDVFVTFLISNSNFDTKEDLEEFYATSMVGSTGGGGGATYSAGLGIEIDSADTITAIYEGYPQVDDEAKTARLSNTTDPFYVMSTNVASTSGATRFKVGGKNRIATYDFAQHTATIDGEEWPDYLTWQWSDSYNMFLITPLQSIPAATADTRSGTTFVMPSGVTLVNSGKTTSVITDLTNKVGGGIVSLEVVSNDYYGNDVLSIKYASANGTSGNSNLYLEGGLATGHSENSLSTRVLKSLGHKWIDIQYGNVALVNFKIDYYVTSVQYDLQDEEEDYSMWITTNQFEEEQILDVNGDVITGLSGVTVTKEDRHVVVTAVATPTEFPNRIVKISGNTSFTWLISNLQAYGYEYTTIDDAVETILSRLGGLKFQTITQNDYDALVSGGTVDSSTLYFIGDSNGYTMKLGAVSVS